MKILQAILTIEILIEIRAKRRLFKQFHLNWNLRMIIFYPLSWCHWENFGHLKICRPSNEELPRGLAIFLNFQLGSSKYALSCPASVLNVPRLRWVLELLQKPLTQLHTDNVPSSSSYSCCSNFGASKIIFSRYPMGNTHSSCNLFLIFLPPFLWFIFSLTSTPDGLNTHGKDLLLLSKENLMRTTDSVYTAREHCWTELVDVQVGGLLILLA